MAEKQKELFSQKVSAGWRSYFISVKEDKVGTRYLVISESNKTEAGYEHSRVTVFENNAVAFAKALEKAFVFLGIDSVPMSTLGKFDQIRQTHPRAYEIWTSEEENELRKFHQRSIAISEIAERLQRQPSAIQSRLHKLGLT